MRKILALLLAALLAAGLIGCGKELGATEPTVPVTMAPYEPVRKTVHILLPEAAASQAMELANIVAAAAELDSTTATYADAEEQTRLLEQIAAGSKGDGSDVVVTLPLSSDMEEVFAQLLEANVTYALADCIPAGAAAASVANVYYDQYEIGAAAAAYLTEIGMTQEDNPVIIQSATEAQTQRTEGFRQYLLGQRAFEGKYIETPWDSMDNLVYSEMQGDTQLSAEVYFETYLSEDDHAAAKYIVAWDDAYALGVLDALEGGNISDTNKQTFLSGGPILTGCGGSAAMRDVLLGNSAYTSPASFGQIRTLDYSDGLLKLATQAMVDYLTGVVVEQDQPQSVTWLTTENATPLPHEG